MRMPQLVGWLVFSYSSLLYLLSRVHTRGLTQIPRTGIRRQTARSHGRGDGAEVALCPWNPKMASCWGGIPRAQCQLQSPTKLPGQRARLGRWGWGGLPPFSSPETAGLYKGSFQRYRLAGLLKDSPLPPRFVHRI